MKRIILLMCALLASASSLAAGYSVTQITDTSYYNEYPKLNTKGDMVWTAWVTPTDANWTLFLYNATSKSTSALSGATVFYNSHQINASGDVIWTATDGNDLEVFLYSAATQTTRQLTSNDNDDTNPQLSDNGNASWIEVTKPSNTPVVMYYDAASMSAIPVVFAGATRQALQTMNADGDMVWTADIGGNQDILLYSAANGAINNISNGMSLISSNERLLDSGDIVWTAYDSVTYSESLMRYKAADASTTTIAQNINGYWASSEGDIAWMANVGSVYSVYTFDPMTETSKVVGTNTGYPLNVAGISTRGDVAWHTINSSGFVSQVYNAETDATIDLTTTQGFGVYEQHMADNGDVAWSLSDGTDYEVYTYQTAAGTLNQLTNNGLDDGVISMNANGTLAWDRFGANYTDSQLFLAVTSDSKLTLDVSKVKLQLDKGSFEIKLLAKFSGISIPSPADTIAINVDKATLLNTPFADFRQKISGVYKYQSRDTVVIIDFNRGTLKVSSEAVNNKAINIKDGLEIKIDFGSASASTNYIIKPRK